MITIDKPFIVGCLNSVKLKSRIIDEKRNINDIIWFETDVCMNDCFDEDTADGFLVSVILPAVVYEEDITVRALVSEQLLYGLNNYVLPILAKAFQKDYIPSIVVNGVHNNFYDSIAVATGCSLGVDSFSSILHHIDEKVLPHYRLSHLTYFNVGAMGSEYAKGTESSFFSDLKKVMRVADLLSLPVVWVNSNIHVLYHGFSFNSTHTFRNMSVVLSMPKFFKKYFYASGFNIENYKIDSEDFGKIEDVILSHLSTESVKLYSDDAMLTRSQKVEYIARYDIVRSNLYVCLKEQIKNDGGDSASAILNSQFLNCSRCEKCLRTLLCLDILGIRDQFEQLFDMDYFIPILR